MGRVRLHEFTDSVFNVAHLLGAVVGCDGTYLFLSHLYLFLSRLCFFLTSIYFLAGYAFFLTTSTDPTFEGFFHARFKTTQKRLMKKRNFDMEPFEELRMIAGPPLRHSACGGLFHAI